MVDQTSKLKRREDVAEGAMAFYFERPSGFSFRAGQFADLMLTDQVETDAKGNTRTFSIASPPYADGLVFITRMRNTAFKRSPKNAPLATEAKMGPAAGSFTLSKNLTKRAILLAGGIGSTPFLSIAQQSDRDRLPQKLYLFILIGAPKTQLSWTPYWP
jgi:ferredoxin-NADP reductase